MKKLYLGNLKFYRSMFRKLLSKKWKRRWYRGVNFGRNLKTVENLENAEVKMPIAGETSQKSSSWKCPNERVEEMERGKDRKEEKETFTRRASGQILALLTHFSYFRFFNKSIWSVGFRLKIRKWILKPKNSLLYIFEENIGQNRIFATFSISRGFEEKNFLCRNN